jgi:hypothetical protein
MDAHLRGLPDARAFLDGDLRAAFADRGVRVETAA